MDERPGNEAPAYGGVSQGAGGPDRARGTASASPSVEERLAVAEALASQHYEAYLRARAEGENIRRRAHEDIVKAHKFALEGLAPELLPVKDSLEATLNASNATLDHLRDGVELTLRQLTAAFEKANLREINPVGEKFDPHKHQAISIVPSDQEANTVVSVLQKGYALADRTIRPALVIVAKPKPAGPAEGGGAPDGGDRA
jgi:molecular chaperone GrpE